MALSNSHPPLRIAVLISGNGSNLQAIIDAIAQDKLNAKIVAVISNKEDAYGLTRARTHKIPTEVVLNSNFSSRESYDDALMKTLDPYHPQIIVLAGFMRILTKEFIHHYPNQILNIHPSLLPKYPGLKTHEQVVENGDATHGATVHIVNEQLDSGPILAYGQLSVLKTDTPNSLKTRVHAIEHQLYPMVLQWFASQRILIDKHAIMLDGKPIPPEGIQMPGKGIEL